MESNDTVLEETLETKDTTFLTQEEKAAESNDSVIFTKSLSVAINEFSRTCDEQRQLQYDSFKQIMSDIRQASEFEMKKREENFQKFMEQSKLQLQSLCRPPEFTSTPNTNINLGQNIDGRWDSEMSHLSFETPRGGLTSSGSRDLPSGINGRTSSERPFDAHLRVIEERESRRSAHNRESASEPHSGRESTTQRSTSTPDVYRGPQTKLPTYEGKEDVDVFLVPFERLAGRYRWNEQEKVDRLYECLKGRQCGIFALYQNQPLLIIKLFEKV